MPSPSIPPPIGPRRRFAPLLLALAVGAALGYWSAVSAPARMAASASTDDAPAGAQLHEHAGAESYTCSMHPSVRLADPAGKCPICFMDLIPAQAGATGLGPEQLALDEAAVALASIRTAVVERRFPKAELRLHGQLRQDESRRIRVTAPFEGRVERVRVGAAGVSVAPETPLVDVSSPELLLAFEDLRRARRTAERSAGASDFLRGRVGDELQRARERLIALGASAAQVDAIERSGEGARTVPLVAGGAGVVERLTVRRGDQLRVGAEIATIDDRSRLWLELDVPESRLALLAVDAPVRFELTALPGERFEGIVALVEPRIDERARSAVARVEVANPDGRLVPGMQATASVRVRVTRDGVGGDASAASMPFVIPASAPLIMGDRAVVYVRVPGGEEPVFEARLVELGHRAGDSIVVREGLRAGEEVVARGAFRLDSEMQIAARPSMMSAAFDAPAFVPATYEEPAATTPFGEVLGAYLDAQEALAEDDLEAFLVASRALDSAVDALDASPFGAADAAAWKRASSRLKAPNQPGSIDEARSRFEEMSKAALELVRQGGAPSGPRIHRAYCPMAFDGRGAEWLQRGEAIRNPYFGASMLRCGELREPLAPPTARS